MKRVRTASRKVLLIVVKVRLLFEVVSVICLQFALVGIDDARRNYYGSLSDGATLHVCTCKYRILGFDNE